jgi:thiamine pyrophosphokinase
MNPANLCYVFGAGAPPATVPEIPDETLVIAADGGFAYTKSVGITADVVIGDFDSLEGSGQSVIYSPHIIRLPLQKDETDMLAALKHGLGEGCTVFHIYGGTGKRLDHTLANIQCLTFLVNRGARGFLYDNDTVVTAMTGEDRLKKRAKGVISVFAIGGPAEGVCLRGLRYGLENAQMTGEFPIGVSNEFIGEEAYIKVVRGTLLLVYPVL